MAINFSKYEAELVSINMIARLTKLDRRTVDNYLEEEGVSYTDNGKSGKVYRLLDVLPALISCSKGQSSADRRNDAQAAKLELEADILRRQYVHIEDVLPAIRAYLGMLNKEIQNSELSDDAKDRMVEKMKETCAKVEEVVDGDEIRANVA